VWQVGAKDPIASTYGGSLGVLELYTSAYKSPLGIIGREEALGEPLGYPPTPLELSSSTPLEPSSYLSLCLPTISEL
jgi:hypothetical protein